MDWFRMYGDMPDDPKVGTLNDAEFRTWVELLCAASKFEQRGDTGLSEKTVDWSLRRDVTVTLERLLDRDLVVVGDNGNYFIRAWDKRQYKSDTSADRTRRYREKLKIDAGLKACDAVVTSPKRHSDALDTDTDTDTEQITTLSGEPDAAPNNLQAQQAIDYLNEKAGANYRHVDSNIRLVKARLSEGYTLADVKAVIDAQVGNWGSNPEMEQYLRPKTLFNATNFSNYAGMATAPESGWWLSAGFESAFDAENHGCTRSNSDQWHDRKRIEVTA